MTEPTCVDGKICDANGDVLSWCLLPLQAGNPEKLCFYQGPLGERYMAWTLNGQFNVPENTRIAFSLELSPTRTLRVETGSLGGALRGTFRAFWEARIDIYIFPGRLKIDFEVAAVPRDGGNRRIQRRSGEWSLDQPTDGDVTAALSLHQRNPPDPGSLLVSNIRRWAEGPNQCEGPENSLVCRVDRTEVPLKNCRTEILPDPGGPDVILYQRVLTCPFVWLQFAGRISTSQFAQLVFTFTAGNVAYEHTINVRETSPPGQGKDEPFEGSFEIYQSREGFRLELNFRARRAPSGLNPRSWDSSYRETVRPRYIIETPVSMTVRGKHSGNGEDGSVVFTDTDLVSDCDNCEPAESNKIQTLLPPDEQTFVAPHNPIQKLVHQSLNSVFRRLS